MDGEDGSYSSSSSSSTCSSSSSSEYDSNEKLEKVQLLGSSFVLPQRLCEDENLFREFMSSRTWNSLDEQSKRHLMNFLPQFPINDRQEKRVTLEKLFNREIFQFNSPLTKFHEDLKEGNFKPNIVKMKKILTKYKRKASRKQEYVHMGRTMRSVIASRDRLMRNSRRPYSSSSSRIQPFNAMEPPQPPPVLHQAQNRTRMRYFQELAAIRSEVGESENLSEDDNYPGGPPQEFFKKFQRPFGSIETEAETSNTKGPVVYGTLGNGVAQVSCEKTVGSSSWLKSVLGMHRYRRTMKEPHPELQTANVKLLEIRQRVNLPPGSVKRIYNVPPSTNNHTAKKRRPVKKEPRKNYPVKAEKRKANFKREKSSSSESNKVKRKYQPSGRKFKADGRESVKPITPPSVKSEVVTDSESRFESDDDSSFIDPVESPKPTRRPSKAVAKITQTKVQKQKSRCPSIEPISKDRLSGISVTPCAPSPVHIMVSPPPPLPPPPHMPTITHPVPIKLEDLEGIDMMDLPVDLDDTIILDGGTIGNDLEININDIKIEVSEPDDDIKDNSFLGLTCHACFLSMIRALFPAPSHRASVTVLSMRLRMLTAASMAPSLRLKVPQPPIEEWCDTLQSALSFLAGDTHPQPPDFVPYLQYLSHLQAYQWIGAGRDSDALLLPLNQFWLEHHQHLRSPQTPTPESPAPISPSTPDDIRPSSPSPVIMPPTSDRSITPPPAICQTTWIVRQPTDDEIEEFHRQERERFSRPHEAYTYNTFGYDSIVGPLIKSEAGVAAATLSMEEGSGSGARGHALLSKWRPRCVTLLALVRDAVARLPNGEGTRPDIATLLTMSQYLMGVDGTITGAVSGALDRLHAPRPRRPTVRYSSRRKVWMYLHRHMNEDEILQIYRQYHHQPAAPAKPRAKKPSNREPSKRSKAAQQKLLLQQQRDKEAVESLLEQEGKSESFEDEIPACTITVPTAYNDHITTTYNDHITTMGAESDSDVDVDDSGMTSVIMSPKTVIAPVTPSPPTPVLQETITPAQAVIPFQTAQTQVMFTQAAPLQVAPVQVAPTQAMSPQIAPIQVMSTQVAPIQTMSTQVMPIQAMSTTQAAPIQVVPAQVIPPQLIPTQGKPSHVNPPTQIPQTQVAMPIVHRVHPTQQTQTVQLLQQIPTLSTQSQSFQSAQNTIKRSAGASLLRSVGTSINAPVSLSSVSRAVGKSLISPGALVDTSSSRRTLTTKGVNHNVMVVSHGNLQRSTAISAAVTSISTTMSATNVTPSSAQPIQLQLSPHSHTHTVQLSTGQTVHLSSGQTVQLSSGQTVQLATTPHQTVQLQRVQNVQTGVQTLQNVQGLQSIQTLQLPALQLAALRKAHQQNNKQQQQQLLAKVIANSQGGHVISLEGNMIRPTATMMRRQTQMLVTSTASSPVVSPSATFQRTGSPIQVRTISHVGQQSQPTQQLVRVMSPALGLARLAKPLLLSKNILLQQAGNNVQKSAAPTILLANAAHLANVRSVSSSSPSTGSVLLTTSQLKSSGGQTVLLGGQPVRLAPSVSTGSAAVRLHAAGGVPPGASVLQLASGHQVKVVPRQLLARLVPSAQNVQQHRQDQ